jgi:hypothetical protein
MLKTIQSVKQETRAWSSSFGPMVSIDGWFSDGEGWSTNCKPDNAQKVQAELSNLIGKPGEFVLEAGKAFQGRTNWKMKSWPGKPQFNGGGGQQYGQPAQQPAFVGQPQQVPAPPIANGNGAPAPRAWNESFAQSKECKFTEQKSITASVAMKHATEFCIANKKPIGELTQIFNLMFAAMIDKTAPNSEPPPQETQAPAGYVPVNDEIPF